MRAWAAALDHARHPPLVIRARIVYARSLLEPIVPTLPGVAASFAFDPPLDAAATEYAYRGAVEGRPAYRMRVSLDASKIVGLVPERPVPSEAVFFYDCATEPDFRGQGLYPAALTAAMEALRRQGRARAYIRVHRGNAASVAGIEKAGFSRCGSVVHVACFGFTVGPFRRRAAAAAAPSVAPGAGTAVR